jgi:hypothetical protein
MFVPALLAVSLPDDPVFADNLQFQITGLIVVIFTLGSLAVLVALIGKVFTTLERHRASTAVAAAPADFASAPSASGEAIPAPVFAAIAAAVSTALGDQNFTIHGVKAADPRENLAWGAEGRRTIYATRKVR